MPAACCNIIPAVRFSGVDIKILLFGVCAVLAVIADLDNGFLSVGGLTSVGRGIFSVEKLCINGQDMTESFRNYDFDKLLEVW